MRFHRFSLLVFLLSVTAPALAQEGVWSTKFADLGVSGKVFALLPGRGDTLYIGGTFTTVAGVAANNIALWDGKVWHALGSGMDQGVYALAFDADNSLIACGDFATAGGQPASCVARWNGSAWSAIGKGVKAPPKSTGDSRSVISIIVTSTHDVYIGGGFTQNGDGDAVNYIAHWNGTKWESLGSGLATNVSGTAHPVVYSMVETRWGLAAGGDFISAGGMGGEGIAFWNNNAWSTPLVESGTAVTVTSMFYAQSSLVFAGNLTAKWPSAPFVSYGGTSFNFPQDTSRFPIGTIAPIGNTVYAGQTPGTTKCDSCGIASFAGFWKTLGAGIDGTVMAMAVSSGGLYVSGDFTHAGGNASDGVAFFDLGTNGVEPVVVISGQTSNNLVTTTGIVNVKGDVRKISAVDLLGRSVSEEIALSPIDDGNVQLDLSRLPNGLYIILTGERPVKVMLAR